MKGAKRLAVSVLLVLGLVMTALPAYAADERLGTVVDGSLLTEETEVEGTAYPKLRGKFFSHGSASLGIPGRRQVRLGGSTSAYQTVNKLMVTVFLQRLEGDNWVHVLTLGPTYKQSANYVSPGDTYTVTGGYYYRGYGHHSVMHDGTTESGVSCTNGVWVD